MRSAIASDIYQQQQVVEDRAADNAIQAAGSPLCMDISEVSGGTSAKGLVITDAQAVASFVAAPAAGNLRAFCGTAKKAYAIGDFKEHVAWGACQALVYNATAASVTLTVGTMLSLKAGAGYFVPSFVNLTGGTSTKGLIAGAGKVHAMVRKAATLTTLQTALLEVWVFPQQAPTPFSFSQTWEATADVPAAGHLFIAGGPFIITRAGFGVATGGNAGSLSLQITVGGQNLFSTAPLIANDCTDPCHTLTLVDTAVATYLGTSGAFGTINATYQQGDKGDIVAYAFTKTSSPVHTGINLQVDGFWL